MAWILLIAFQSVTFAIQVDSWQECAELGRLNLSYAREARQPVPILVCTKTIAA